MNKRYKQTADSKGFTIIEVVLVLAIAGLIFLMVFIALPALQKGQRDAQRKSDLSRISVQMQSYLQSTRGTVPNSPEQLANFVDGYLNGEPNEDGVMAAGDEYVDPNGNRYVVSWRDKPNGEAQIGYYSRSKCDPQNVEEGVSDSDAARDYAFTIYLENQDAPFCIEG